MASWKKIIVSGSNAELNHITSSGNLEVTGNISGSVTSTGSFGRVSTGKIRASQLRLSKNATEASDTTISIEDFGGGNKLTLSNGATSLVYDGRHGQNTAGLNFNVNFSGMLGNAAATSTNPSIKFTGDTDTGLGRADANQLSLIAGGVEAFRVTSTLISGSATSTGSFGRVELGQSEGAPMAVYGNAATAGIRLENYKGYFEVDPHTSTVNITSDKDEIQFQKRIGARYGITGYSDGDLEFFTNSGNTTHATFSHTNGTSFTQNITGSGNLEIAGNISGSATSTGSFGHVMVGGNNFITAVSESAAASGFGGGGATITALNNQTANRLVTIGSTTTELDGEANLTFDGTELRVQGDIVAENFIVSSSVTYMTQSFSSGSTIFGNTLDDTHQFTGSLLVTGSATITGSLNVRDDITSTTGHISLNQGKIFTAGGAEPKFEMETNAGSAVRFHTSEGSYISVGANASAFGVGHTTTGKHKLRVDGRGTLRPFGIAEDGTVIFDVDGAGNVTGSGHLEIAGNISGSATSTGSFGHLELGNADTDASFEFGRAHIGHIGYSDMAGFSHVDLDATTTFALAQNSSGKTIVNAASGQQIALKINNADKVSIDATGLSIGTDTPAHPLHVVGDGFFTGNISGSSTSTGSLQKLILSETSKTALAIGHDGTDSDQNTVDIRSNDSSTSLRLVSNNDANDYYDAIFRANYNDLNSVELEGPSGRVFLEYRHTGRKTLIGHSDGNTEVVSTILSGSAASTGSFGSLILADKIQGDVTVGGNLIVEGDTIQQQVANLNIEDRFILLNSGSASGDGGLIVQTESHTAGVVYGYDDDESRWGFQQGTKLSATGSAIAPDAYASAVVTSDDANYQKNGNIRVEGGEIYIYVE
mgnify:CR=1 FL=1